LDRWFDTIFSSVVVEDGWCKGVIVENKEGRIGYRATMFVDALGDGDLMKRAGATCVEDGNWLTYWAYSTNLAKISTALEKDDVLLRRYHRLDHKSDEEHRNPVVVLAIFLVP
jgi:hypothetical protein